MERFYATWNWIYFSEIIRLQSHQRTNIIGLQANSAEQPGKRPFALEVKEKYRHHRPLK